MSTKVSITKSKLDSLANAVSVKSGTAIPLTIDEMTTAVMNISGGGSTPDLQTKSVSYAPTTSQQTAAVTADAGYDGLETVNVTISAIQTETASVTPTTSSQTITPTSGHFFDEVSVGAVSLQDDKYIAISQSGYTSFTPDNGYMGISAGDVYVPVSTPGVSTVASYSNPPEINPIGYNDQYVNIDSGFIETGKSYKVACVPFGSVTAPSTITGTSATVSTGTNTLTLSKTVSVTPSVTTAGYVSSGTAGNSSVSLTASVTTQAAQTIYPSASDQTITGSKYLTGTQTIKGVTTTNLTADNIKSGVTVQIGDSADSDRVASVTGTYSGGGTSKNVQVVQGTTRTTSSTMTAIGAEMTVSKTGTYDVYWSAFRSNTSSQYTFATQLYVGGAAYGSEQTTWSNHQQNVHLSNVSLTVNQKIRVYGRESRGSSYYMYAGTLTIVEA